MFPFSAPASCKNGNITGRIAMNQIEMRLRGTKAELDLWLWFLRKMEGKGLITLLSASEFRADSRGGDSREGRMYIKIRLNIDARHMDDG